MRSSRTKGLAALSASALLAGCATTAAGLGRSDVEQVIDSDKPSQAFATCVAESLRWNVQLRNEGDHYWVMRINGYGTPTVRWDFHPREGGGSRAELRTSIPVMGGDEKVRACA